MEAMSELMGFISAIGDEISNIILGDGDEDAAAEDASVAIRPIVIAGPSGVGKGTLIAKLMKEYPAHFGFSVSHTTRDPRPGEEDGVDYHFTDRGTMATMIDAGEFIESADVHGNYYGTSKAAVTAVAAKNKICILDIDVQGVQSVKKAQLEPEPVFIFINTPSMEELESRLRGRGTENEEKIQRRLVNAKAEIAYGTADDNANFDLVLVNNKIDDTFTELKEFLAPGIGAVVSAQEAVAPPAAATEPATPTIADLIAEKEKLLEKANTSKDRAAAKSLLAEIEALEEQAAAAK